MIILLEKFLLKAFYFIFFILTFEMLENVLWIVKMSKKKKKKEKKKKKKKKKS